MKKSLLPLFVLLILGLNFSLVSAQLVINEIDYDQPGTDSSEFIELYNGSANTIDLADYSILLFNGNTSALSLYDSLTLPTFSLPPGGYFTICGSSTGLIFSCDTFLAPAIGTGLIQNGGSGATPASDAVALRYNPTDSIVDAVSYEGNCPIPYIEGNGIPDSLSDNGDSTSSNMSISRYPNGSDSNDNAADFFFVCSTPGATNCIPTQTIQVIRVKPVLHVFPNPASTSLFFFGVTDASLNYDVKIYDMHGKLCISKNMPVSGYGVFQVDLSSLTESGLYSLVITNESANYSEQQNFVVIK